MCHLCTIAQLCRPSGILIHRTQYLELASRPTQRLWLYWVYIPTVTEDILLQPVLACCSTLEVLTTMCHIKLHFTYLLHLRSWGMYRRWEKKLVEQQYLFHMSSQYGELQPSNGWGRFVSLWHPCKFQQVSHLGIVTAPTSLNGGQPNFARCLAVSWAGTLYIH